MQEFSRRATKKFERLSDEQKKRFVASLSSKFDTISAVFNSVLEGFLVVSGENEFHLLLENSAAKRLLPRSAKSSDCPVWELILDSDIARFLETNLSERRTNVTDEFSLETNGGAVRFLELSISPFEISSGEIGSIIRVEDTTEKRNQEILLRRMEAMASLTTLAASVAHEIKNPLGAISIHIQLMQKAIKKSREGDGLLPEPKFAERYLDVVSDEIERLNKIVVNFLMAVRPISANLELSNPNVILEQFVSFFKPEFTEKKIELESNFCENCPRLLIDEKLFRDVIVNLAQNALAAIEKRLEVHTPKIPGCILISTKIKDDFFILRFRDNGIGMDDETASRVFEPYFTTKSNGTGLGMAMSYKIIKEFSGDISVKSILGEGTEFTISIPIPQKDKMLLPFKCNDSSKKAEEK